MHVAFVGGGAATVSLLYHLVHGARHLPYGAALEITIFEKKPEQLGRGTAYMDDLESNLLNTRAAYISPICGAPGEFYEWLTSHCADPDTTLKTPSMPHREDFLPRPLFGRYLRFLIHDLMSRARASGRSVEIVYDEVIDLTPQGTEVLLHTRSDTYKSDYVVLCCGDLPAVPPTLTSAITTHPRFVAYPYPLRDTLAAMQPCQCVAVLGTRLSAIDAAIAFLENGACATVHLISPSGELPRVRGTQPRIAPILLRQSAIEERCRAGRAGSLGLADILQLLCEEHFLQSGERPDLSEILEEFHDPQAFLDAEIKTSAHDRLWQAVLYATNPVIDLLWKNLKREDRRTFLRDFISNWMRARVSIPVENARKLHQHLKRGALFIHSSVGQVIAYDERRIAISTARETVIADYLVNATGTSREVFCLQSPLIHNLSAAGIVRAGEHGGLDVDFDTANLISRAGVPWPNIGAIGSLTCGAYFFTSALDIIARHANALSRRLYARTLHRSMLRNEFCS